MGESKVTCEVSVFWTSALNWVIIFNRFLERPLILCPLPVLVNVPIRVDQAVSGSCSCCALCTGGSSRVTCRWAPCCRPRWRGSCYLSPPTVAPRLWMTSLWRMSLTWWLYCSVASQRLTFGCPHRLELCYLGQGSPLKMCLWQIYFSISVKWNGIWAPVDEEERLLQADGAPVFSASQRRGLLQGVPH